MGSGDPFLNLEETEEQRTQRRAIARRKRTSTIARPRDWKRKGHAYRSRAAMESGSRGPLNSPLPRKLLTRFQELLVLVWVVLKRAVRGKIIMDSIDERLRRQAPAPGQWDTGLDGLPFSCSMRQSPILHFLVHGEQ